MSADNGIYIGKFPTNSECTEFEYRVIEAAAIENVDYGTKAKQDAYRVSYFGRTERVFSDRKEALVFAHDWAEEFDILEYGVCELKFDRPLVSMSEDKIKRILDW
jgi:hypothetical protein